MISYRIDNEAAFSVERGKIDSIMCQRQIKQSSKGFDWTDESVHLLNDSWQKQPILYDSSHSQHHVKEIRKNGIQKVADELMEARLAPCPTPNDVKKSYIH